MTPYLLIFLAGLAGSLHCIGMCGGFACGIGPDARGRTATAVRHLVYNTGRVTTYCFLGGLAGYLGAHFIHLWEGSALGIAQRLLAGISGALMMLIGLQFFGFFQSINRRLIGFGGQLLTQALRELLKDPHPAAPLAFGVLNGFLPCPLVYAFGAQAAASGGPLSGVLVMAAFGLGTFPAMLMMGGVGALFRSQPQADGAQTYPVALLKGSRAGVWLRSDWRVQGVRFAGAFIVLLGLITVARGVLPWAAHGHHL
ncbi:MAG: sulfite exporter TauE/SafE family protein [Gammaproteobacteria bacterium]|nr:sulfite exporter TauE/SafE family protein [Gammaproteobacteria bacterium]